MIKFKTNKKEFQETINSALKFKSGHKRGWVPVITICKLRKTSRDCFYAFHYDNPKKVKVGDIQYLEDLSVRRIEKIL